MTMNAVRTPHNDSIPPEQHFPADEAYTSDVS